jgi:hypothetical protein
MIDDGAGARDSDEEVSYDSEGESDSEGEGRAAAAVAAAAAALLDRDNLLLFASQRRLVVLEACPQRGLCERSALVAPMRPTLSARAPPPLDRLQHLIALPRLGCALAASAASAQVLLLSLMEGEGGVPTACPVARLPRRHVREQPPLVGLATWEAGGGACVRIFALFIDASLASFELRAPGAVVDSLLL